jgi:hypothetical protein
MSPAQGWQALPSMTVCQASMQQSFQGVHLFTCAGVAGAAERAVAGAAAVAGRAHLPQVLVAVPQVRPRQVGICLHTVNALRQLGVVLRPTAENNCIKAAIDLQQAEWSGHPACLASVPR